MFFNFLTKSAVFLVLFVHFSNSDENKKHKYNITVEKMEVTKGSDILTVDLNVEKTGPVNFKINGFVQHSKQFNENWPMRLEVVKRNSLDEKESFDIFYPNKAGKDVCSYLKNEYKKFFYDSLKDYSDAPHFDTCPLDPAKYTVNGYPFDASAFEKHFSVGYFDIKFQLSSSDLSQLEIEYLIRIHVVENGDST